MNVPQRRAASKRALAPIFVDVTHCAEGRAVTGIERVALELFSAQSLSPLPVIPISASGRMQMTWKQSFVLPALLAARRNAILLCPGFPPTPGATAFGPRVLPYIHDLFLITRPGDLNWKARAYMAPSFRLAIKRSPRFFVNSQKTSNELRGFCRPDAQIHLFRPAAANPFSLEAEGRAARTQERGVLKLIALGTVEPRKNLGAAAAILTALRAKGYPDATLDLVGRIGWGAQAETLSRIPGVTLHGFQHAERVRELASAADFFITTSHDEGLGSPPLEAQWAGLPIIAPEAPVFHETLERGGIFINSADPASAAERIAAVVSEPGWRARYGAQSTANVMRWNALCEGDRVAAIALIEKLAAGVREC